MGGEVQPAGWQEHGTPVEVEERQERGDKKIVRDLQTTIARFRGNKVREQENERRVGDPPKENKNDQDLNFIIEVRKIDL